MKLQDRDIYFWLSDGSSISDAINLYCELADAVSVNSISINYDDQTTTVDTSYLQDLPEAEPNTALGLSTKVKNIIIKKDQNSKFAIAQCEIINPFSYSSKIARLTFRNGISETSKHYHYEIIRNTISRFGDITNDDIQDNHKRAHTDKHTTQIIQEAIKDSLINNEKVINERLHRELELIKLEREQWESIKKSEENDLAIKKEKLQQEYNLAALHTNTQERRSIRADLITRLDQPIGKIINTQLSSRRSIIPRMLHLSFSTIAGCLAYYYITKFSLTTFNSPWIQLAAILKTSSVTAVLFASIIYWIKFERYRHDKHMITEYNTHKFRLDMERASWLVETSLEYHLARNMEIPPSLIECMSNNLFVPDSDTHANNQSANDPLNKLLSSYLFKLKHGNTEIELNGKESKKPESK